MLTKLARWARGRSNAPLSGLEATVYCREECGCCDKALDTLREFQDRYGFSIREVDVDSDPVLADQHGLFVPVVEIGGKVRFKGKVNPILLERILDAEGRGA